MLRHVVPHTHSLLHYKRRQLQCSNLHSNKKDYLHTLQWFIVSKIVNKSLQIHTLLFPFFILSTTAYCGDVFSFIHFLILEKAKKYSWMRLFLCFCRWNIHKKHYSQSNRPFQHQSRGKQKWISHWRLQDVAKTWWKRNKLIIYQFSIWKWFGDTPNGFLNPCLCFQ
jgi:hypothetical protein